MNTHTHVPWDNDRLNKAVVFLDELLDLLPYEAVIALDDEGNYLFDPQTGKVRGPDGTSHDAVALLKEHTAPQPEIDSDAVVVVVNEHGHVLVRQEPGPYGPVLVDDKNFACHGELMERSPLDDLEGIVKVHLVKVHSDRVKGGRWMTPCSFVEESDNASSTSAVMRATRSYRS